MGKIAYVASGIVAFCWRGAMVPLESPSSRFMQVLKQGPTSADLRHVSLFPACLSLKPG